MYRLSGCYHRRWHCTVPAHGSSTVPDRRREQRRPLSLVNASDGKSNLTLLGSVVLGACALVLLAAVLAWFHTVSFERDLARAVLERLAAAGFEDVQLEVDGRDVVFRGEVEARVDRRRMLELAREVEGVENVFDQRIVTNYEKGRHFRLHSYAGITTVEGELPEPGDIALVLEAIQSHYGVDPLGSDLKVRPAVRRPGWLDDFASLLHATGAVSPLQIEYGDGSMTVAGEVTDRETRDRVQAELAALLDESIELNVLLRLPSQVKEPELRIEYKNGRVSADGTVPEDEFAHELIAALALAFAVDEVENNLRVDPDVRHSSWLESVLRVVFPLAMTHWMDLEIRQGEVLLRGSVSDDDELSIISEQIRDNFDYDARVINRLRKQADTR